MNPEEVRPLSYIAVCVLQSPYKKSKNYPHWNSPHSFRVARPAKVSEIGRCRTG